MTRTTGNIVEIKGRIKKETDKALLFIFGHLDNPDVEVEAWFPFSQIQEIHHEEPVILVVTEWIYKKKLEELESNGS